MPMKPYPPMRPRQPIVQREWRGVNKEDPFSLADGYYTEAENFISSGFPAVTTRPGFSVLGQFGTRVLGAGVWKDQELHFVFNDGTWRRLNTDGTWTTLASGLSTSEEWSFTNFMGDLSDINLIGSNGVNGIRRYDGSSVQTLSNAPSNGNYITTYQNRLWCYVSSVNEIWASTLDKANEWDKFTGDDNDSFRKPIESPSGEKVNGLFSELAKMTISFPNSTKKLLGGVASDFNDQSVSQTIGIVNNKSAVTIDGFMHFYSTKGFYQYGGGISPDKTFSNAVQYYADNAKASGRSLSVVGTDGKYIYFSLAMDGDTPDTLLVYDQANHVWNVWKGFSALHIARMDDSLYIGDASGRAIKLGGTSDNGTPIVTKLVSKPFTAPSMAQKVRWLRFWVTLDLPTGSSIRVFLSKSEKGDSDWVQAGTTIQGSGTIARRPIYFPSGIIPPTEQIRFKIEGSGPFKIHEIAWDPTYMPIR